MTGVKRTDTELVRAVYEAAAGAGPQSLIDRYDEFFAPDFEWRPVLVASLYGRAHVGRDAFAAYWREFSEAFDEVQLGEGTFEQVGDGRVLVSARLQARGASGGVPIDHEVAYLFEVADGRISRGATFFSPADAREALAGA